LSSGPDADGYRDSVTSVPAYAVLAVAGLAAGAINTVVGSGTLITFPVLLSLGVPPITANVSNTIGLVPGSVAGAVGYRGELVGQRHRLTRLATASGLGGLVGAVLLLALPSGVFAAVVPALIGLAIVLVLAQPRLSVRLLARSAAVAPQATGRVSPPNAKLGPHPSALWLLVGLCGVYGGYFGAAQSVLLLAILGTLLDQDLQRVNGIKNVLAGLVNGIAGLIFLFLAHPNWTLVAIIALTSTAGGLLGAGIGRRLPAPVLRAVIVVIGLAALARFVLS
jgi:uncharacterized membrane protein YfcA